MTDAQIRWHRQKGGPPPSPGRPRLIGLRRWQLLGGGAVTLLALFHVSCSDSVLWAVGPTERMALATSFDPNDGRVRRLEELFEEPVLMVRPEQRFQVEHIPPSLFESNRNLKCLCILTDLRAPGAFEDAVRTLISREEREQMVARDVDVRIIENVWARGQAIMLVHARTRESLAEYLDERGERLVARYDELLQAAIAPAVLAFGRNDDMESYLRQTHGIAIGIPKGYEVGEDAEESVVRLYRTLEGEPARFVLIHWLPASEAPETPEACMQLRDRLGYVYYDGDRVLDERSFSDQGSFQDQPAMILEGVWQNDKYVIGGPFRSFGFLRGDRFYLVDVSVFNPPGEKLPYLREVLAIARTFEDVRSS